MKVIEVTKTNYTLENGDVYEHTFDIDVSSEEELATDIISLMASFSGKFYGRRSAERRKKNKK